MALVACRECGNEVSTEAKTCPHCGTSKPAMKPKVNQPVNETVKAAGSRKWIKNILILAAIGMVASVVVPKNKAGSKTGASIATTVPANPDCSIRKADGRPGDRECDLVELCKDRSYLGRKVNSAQTMDDRVAAMADLGQVQRWLSEYRPDDVQRVCSRN